MDTLQDAATQATYFEYLEQKFGGTDIQWQILQYALKWFNLPDQWFLSKFIHKWLPLLDWHHTISISCDKTCPSCCQMAETMDHFLSCLHDTDCIQVWKELHEQLQRHQIEHTKKQHLSWPTCLWPLHWMTCKYHHLLPPCPMWYTGTLWSPGIIKLVSTILQMLLPIVGWGHADTPPTAQQHTLSLQMPHTHIGSSYQSMENMKSALTPKILWTRRLHYAWSGCASHILGGTAGPHLTRNDWHHNTRTDPQLTHLHSLAVGNQQQKPHSSTPQSHPTESQTTYTGHS